MTSLSSNAAEDRGMRKWFFGALIVSLIFHGLLYEIFRAKQLERFDPGKETARLVPRAFSVKQVKIDPKLFESKPDAKAEAKAPDLVKVNIPSERPTADKIPKEVRATPNATADLTKSIVNDKPRVGPSASEKLTPKDNAATQRELDSLRAQLITSTAPKIVAGAQIHLPEGVANGDKDGKGAGFSDIDALLSDSAPLTGNVAPVSMPGGALFDYNSAKLEPKSIDLLNKLGELIKRNPHAKFSIEGHTDSFGTPDYNLKLSTARAEAVKEWLVAKMGVNPTQIQTKGYGSTRLIEAASGTIEQQAPNRRVEIVITTPKD
ncbi:MAG: OmpA family protein [Verrucomicrobiota bacterium]